MRICLVMTLGTTDVQVVHDGRRFDLDPWTDRLAAATDRGAAVIHFVEAPVENWGWRGGPAPDFATWPLCTPKFDAVHRHILSSKDEVTGILILDTRRKPREAIIGTLMLRRLKELDYPAPTVCSFLVAADDTLEDHSDPSEGVIRRAVVRRIDDAVRNFLATNPAERVIVAATGGLPSVAELVEDVVQLHLPRRSIFAPIEIPDGTKQRPPQEDRVVPRSFRPSSSFQARRHALDLIEKGNPLAAWGAIEHIHLERPSEHWWTREVEALSQFAASLPIMNGHSLPLPKTRAERSALRVEMALRARDVPRAVHGVVAFFESAVQDHLDLRMTAHGPKLGYRVLSPPPDPQLVVQGRDQATPSQPFHLLAQHGAYRLGHSIACNVTCAEKYLCAPELLRFGKDLNRVQSIRNDVAHDEPTETLMEGAFDEVEQLGYWSKIKDDRRTFLEYGRTIDVLAELGKKDSKLLWVNLQSAIRTRLLSPSPIS